MLMYIFMVAWVMLVMYLGSLRQAEDAAYIAIGVLVVYTVVMGLKSLNRRD